MRTAFSRVTSATPISLFVITLALMTAFRCNSEAQAADGETGTDFFPLTPAQMLDESTLDIKVLSDESFTSALPSGAGRTLRKVRVRYFSHQWKDGSWEGKVDLLIPKEIPANRRGVVFFSPGSSIHVEEGVDVQRDLWERTTVELGIITASIPDAGRHLGEEEIHAVSDAFTIRAIESRDLSWLPAFSFAALRARAATAIGKLTGEPVHTVIHMGSSITVSHAWNWPLHDPRVKGLIATGDIGNIEDWFPLDGSLKEFPRRAFVEVSQCPKEFQQQAIHLLDSFYFAGQLHNVLQIAGSNDHATPPGSLPKFFAALGEPKHLAIVPNYGHGCASRRHAELARMWLDHLLDGRPLTQVAFVEPPRVLDGQLRIRARVQGQAEIKQVQFVYATTAEPTFLRSVLLPGASKEKGYTHAQWKTVSMTKSADANHPDEWTGAVELPAGKSAKRFVAGFVDVEDRHEGRAGYVATGVHWLALD